MNKGNSFHGNCYIYKTLQGDKRKRMTGLQIFFNLNMISGSI